MSSLIERTQKLELILAAHILSLAKSIDWQLLQRLNVTLLQLRATHTIRYHGVPLIAFDVSFQANIYLPENIGLEKASTHGFGVVTPFVEAVQKNKRPRISKMHKEMEMSDYESE